MHGVQKLPLVDKTLRCIDVREGGGMRNNEARPIPKKKSPVALLGRE